MWHKIQKVLIWILLVVSTVLCIGLVLFQISKSRSFQFFGGLTNRIETTEKVVALTFDDAPTEHSDEVLRILEEKDVRATFYVIGSYIETHPQDARKIVEAGHELGNHSYSHPRFLLTSLSFVKDEIDRTNILIRDIGYEGEITFRPPYGKKLFMLPWYLKQQGIKTITWDVEPDTYVPGDAEKIFQYTVENTKPGSIILMHPFCGEPCEADREALPRIIDELREQGYRFVTVGELLGYEV